LEFSRRERIQNHRQKANDLAREAVGWNGGLGGRAINAPSCDLSYLGVLASHERGA
jgi:hypothetical protein